VTSARLRLAAVTYAGLPGNHGRMDGRTPRMSVTAAPPATLRIHAAVQRVRAFDARHPLLWDALLTALVTLPGVVQIADGDWRDDARGQLAASAAHPAELPVAVPWLVLAGLVLPLLWRRRHPFAAMCAIAAVMFAHDYFGLVLASMVSIGIALFNIALRLPLSRLAWTAGVIASEIALDMLREPPDDFFGDYVPVFAIAATIVMTGITVRTRREYVASLLERAERLEIERDQKARLAAAAERARVAREMHDIIAHNLSVIVGLADGGAYAAKNRPERPAQALGAISATGRQALGELRRLLGVLREEGPGPGPASASAELAPQPGLTDLGPLLDRVRAAGLPVRCTVCGEARALSEGRQLTVYRIVQEALTNTLKHAGSGARAEVVLACADGADGAYGAVDIEVTDTGRGPAGALAAGGQGIHGMRERAALYDGVLEAGPAPGGGWRVRASLPAVVEGAV